MIVKTHGIDSLLETMRWDHADLIKFDIEGAEWEVFEGTPLQNISSLIGEYHEDLTGKPVQEFVNLFVGFKSKVNMVSRDRYIVQMMKMTNY